MKKRLLEKFLALFFVLVLVFNTNAALVADNDRSGFVTKSEFDQMKTNIKNKMDSYNKSVDEKIDGAIAAYLSHFNLSKEEKVPLGSGITSIYCMYTKKDTETKDLSYVWSQPKVSGKGCTTTFTPNIGSGGCYLHEWTFNSKTPSATGERNLIKNLYNPGTASSPQSGYAEWVGHVKNVYDDLYFDASGYDRTSGLALHFNPDNCWPSIGYRFGEPTYQKTTTEEDWLLFKWCPMFYSSATGSQWWPSSGNWKIANALVKKIQLNKDNATYSKQNMIVWKDETYYAFTENDQNRFLYFDAYDVNGESANTKTTAPVMYTKTNYTNFYMVTPGWWAKWFNSVTYWIGYEQYNIGDKAFQGTAQNLDKMQYSNSTSQTGDFADYYTRTNRILWPCIGFPYKTINNWNQLYKSENDWAANIDAGTSTSVVDIEGSKHLLMKGGWPVVALEDEYEYKVDIKFAETDRDHLVFAKLEPFTTNNPESEELWHTWIKGTKPKTDSRFTNSILVEAGKTVTLDFVNYGKNNVLYLKWCDRPSETETSPTLNGGGTIILPDNVTIIREMDVKEKEN